LYKALKVTSAEFCCLSDYESNPHSTVSGVKITAKDLEKAIAGVNLLVAHHPDQIDLCKNQVNSELGSALGRIQLQDRGVYVQASTLGSLEALLEFLKKSEIPVSLVSNCF
jgi:translation initiation factor 5B